MDKRDFLYRLIHSMNQSEKRFFKLYSNLYSSKKQKNYIILFELYEKQTVYDEKEIKKGLSEIAELGNINVLRRYLKEQILTSLKLFHRKEIGFSKHDEFQSSILLINKGFYLDAEKILTRLINSAIKDEDYNFILICLTKLINIKEFTGYDSIESLKFINELNQKRAHFLSLYKEYIKIQSLFRKVKETIYFNNTLQGFSGKLNEILENEMKPLENKVRSVKSRFVFYYTKSYIYYNLSDQKNNIKELEKIEQLLSDYPNIIKPINRSSIIINLSLHYISTGQKEKYLEKKQIIEDFIKIKGKHQSIYNYWKYILVYEYYYRNLDEAVPENLNKELLELIQKKGITPSNEQRIALHYRLTRHVFFNGEFEQAIEHLNNIRSNNKIDWSNYYFLSIHCLLLISYIETNDAFSFKQEYSFLKRKIEREKEGRSLVVEVLKILSKLIKNEELDKKSLNKLKTIIKKNKEDLLFGIKLEFLSKWAQLKLDKIK